VRTASGFNYDSLKPLALGGNNSPTNEDGGMKIDYGNLKPLNLGEK